MQRLIPGTLGRILHESLYKRITSFCAEHTPEFPPHNIAHVWLRRFFDGDNALHILVEMDEGYNIIAHAIIDIQDMIGVRIVYCQQLQVDNPKDTTIVDFISEYLDKLVQDSKAYGSCLLVERHQKVYEKKYGYKSARTFMVKKAQTDNSDDNEE